MPLSRFAILFVAAASAALAQSARITGRVTDSTGAVVPETSITVTNIATGADRKVTTSADGNYTVPLLLPGEYRLRIEHPGFKPVTRSGVILDVDQRAELDFILEAEVAQPNQASVSR